MELVIGLFAAAGTAAPAAAAAAGTAGAALAGVGAGVGAGAAGLASLAGGASTALSILQGAATVGSSIFSLASGFSQSVQEDLAGKAEANRIKREELIKIGQLRVAFAGSGIDIDGGQALSLEEDIRSQSDFEVGMARSTGRMRSRNAMLRGVGQAFGTASGGLLDIARRG